VLIGYGYEITVTCAQPTPMVCLLSVGEGRKTDIRVAEKMFTTPIIATTKLIGDRLEIPSWIKVLARCKRSERLLDKSVEMLAQQRPQQQSRVSVHA
jgi:hypothetical protein